MPFYFRKSVSAGPFRFNFSKGGVGASVGVKGLRVGVGPRGHYVQAGIGGLRYRSTIGRPGERRPPANTSPKPISTTIDGVDMVEVESGDVLLMRETSVGDLLDDINAKLAKTPLGKIVGWCGIALGGLLLFADATVAMVVWALTLPAWLFARWLDSYQRRSVLYYDLEPQAQSAYERLTETFDSMTGCAGKWHIAAGGEVRDLTTWKRNAGASHIVNKKPTTLTYELPNILASNLTPPSAKVGVQTLYFLPDVVLVVHGKHVGAVGYADLTLRWQDSNFIEEGVVPRDAAVIGQTWKHPNKNGGPDRRFKDNRQIPICRYEVLHFNSASGLNELLEFSKTGVSPPFIEAVHALAAINGRLAVPKLAAERGA